MWKLGVAIGAALLVLACGSDDSRLSDEAYFSELTDLQSEFEKRGEETFGEEARESATVGDFVDFIDDLLGDYLKELNDLSPPEELADEHQELTAALEDYLEAAEKAAADIGRDEDVANLFESDALDDEGQRSDDAACALQAIADDKGVDADVGCEEQELRTTEFKAGRVQDFTVGSATRFQEEQFWLVRLQSGDFLALDEHGLDGYGGPSGCSIAWQPDFEFMGQTSGWFVDPCNDFVYDRTGRCVRGPPPVPPTLPGGYSCSNLGRFPLAVCEGEVVVNLGSLIRDPPAYPEEPMAPSGESLNLNPQCGP